MQLLRLGRPLPRRPALQAEARLARLRGDHRRAGATLRKEAPVGLLGLALLGAVAVLLSFTAELTFFQDSWEFLMNRRAWTADALLQPHNEHIVVLPVAIELVLLHLFGMSSAMPEAVVLTALLSACAVLIFVYVRRRVGPWLALMAAVLLLFLGPAWQDLLWPATNNFAGSVLFGVAMLLALEQEGRRWNVAACVFLALSIGFSSLGIAFAVGAAVDVLQRRRDRGMARAWVAALPLVLFALWYWGWGSDAEDHLSLHNVLVSPRFVLEAMSAAADALLGFTGITDQGPAQAPWGPALLIALAALIAYVRWPGPARISPRLWPVAATAATFWFLAAFNHIPGREPYSSRYLYAGAAFLIMIAANLLAGVRIGRRALLLAGAVTVLAAGANLIPLRDGRDFLEWQTVLTRADLAAIEIARQTIDPSFGLAPEVAGTPFLIDVNAGEYLPAVEEFGSPAYTPAELAAAPEYGRAQADVVLANALPVSIETEAAGEGDGGGGGGGQRGGGGGGQTSVGGREGGGGRGDCRPVPPGARRAFPLVPGLTTIELAAGPPATIRLRRFAAAEFPLVSEGVPGGSTTLLRVPADRSPRPWRLRVEAPGGATVCWPVKDLSLTDRS